MTNLGQVANSKKKILRIITRLNIGGPAIHTVILTAGLDRTRFQSLLVTGTVSEDEGDMSYFAYQHSVNPVIIPELGKEIDWKTDLIVLYKLFRLMKSEKPDIVHTHTAKAGTLGRIAAILSGVPFTVHTFHGHVLHSYFGKFRTKIFILIERLLARFTSKIIAVSPLQYCELHHQIKIAPSRKFAIIPLGFDLTHFLNAQVHCGKLRGELRVSEDVLLVGIIGRLTAIKNHALFLRSAARVLEKFAEARFLIVGDGELADELKGLAYELRIQDRVIFLGWRDDMPAIYADLDLVVLTSLNEGTPVSLIEAMASAKPIVATAVGGIPDIVLNGEMGILVPSGDEEKLATTMINLLEEAGKRRDFGKRGRESVRNKYTRERLVADMAGLYENLLSTPRM
jgi:glycosyltransferase involved in cell wall biosynthesis